MTPNLQYERRKKLFTKIESFNGYVRTNKDHFKNSFERSNFEIYVVPCMRDIMQIFEKYDLEQFALYPKSLRHVDICRKFYKDLGYLQEYLDIIRSIDSKVVELERKVRYLYGEMLVDEEK